MSAELQPPPESPSPGRNLFRSRVALICFFILAGTVALFWPIHSFDFVGYDDPYYITGNPYVQAGLTIAGLKWAFTHVASQATYWHPLTWLSHMVDVQLFGMKPGPHHLMNLFYHAINAVVVFLLLNRLTKALWPSAIVAALFAWHPIQVETVSWVTERKNMLSTLFMLLTIWAYARFVERAKSSPLSIPATEKAADETSGAANIAVADQATAASEQIPVAAAPANSEVAPDSKVDAMLDVFVAQLQWAFGFAEYRWVLVLYIMGLMCKPMLVTLPVVLLLLDFWPLGRVARSESDATEPSQSIFSFSRWVPLIVEKTPLFIFAAVSSWITLVAHEQLKYFLPVSQIPLGMRLANVVTSYVRYIEHIVFPANLCAIYPYNPNIDTIQFALATFLMVGLTYVAISSVRRRPQVCFGWLWFLITLLPVIGVVQVGAQAMADRFAYVPLIGLLIMVVFGVADCLKNLSSRRMVLGAVAFALLAAALVVSVRQIPYWQNSFSLFGRALAVTDRNPIAHYNLGMAYLAKGDGKAAKSHFYDALQIAPGYTDARNNYAAALVGEGKVDEAIQQYHEIVRHNPKSSIAHYNIGALLSQQGKMDEAFKEYNAALECDPNNAEAHNNVGNALLQAGKMQEGADHIMTAVRLNPNNPQAQFSAGNLLMRMQRVPEALQHYAEAVRVKPDYAEAHYNFGNALATQGQFDQALYQFSEAARLNPKAAELRLPIGMAATELGKVDEAVKAYREALTLKADFMPAQVNLAWILASARDPKFRNGDEAIRLANGAAEKTENKDPSVLDLLAAAYAESGKFPQATKTAEKALTLAESSGQKPLVDQIQSHLKFYREGKPYHVQ